MNIISFSGGKDSAATVILAHLNRIEIDEIIFSEVMFDKEESGELPEHIDFIKTKAFPLFNEWGYKTTILHSEYTYMDCFNKKFFRSKVPERNGKRRGFPMGGKCAINQLCKVRPIKQYLKAAAQAGDLCQFIGIAADEPERLKGIDGKTKRSLLAEAGIKEEEAFELADKHGVLSPVYDFSPRGGCWFCMNDRDCEIRHLREKYPEKWQKLIELEKEKDIVGNIWDTRKRRSATETEERMRAEDAQMTIWDFIKKEDRREI